ncbi:MAG: hypothetical protein FJY65_05875 [Calditrichaeota bacterium]|nr:hypothetical protein [Calditrichota bacterium]
MPPLKKNEKVMVTLIGVSVIVFVAMDPYYIIWKKKPSSTTTPADTTHKAAAAPGAAIVDKLQPQAARVTGVGRPQREPVPYTNWGRDPFVQARRYIDDETTVAELKLGGISVRGEDRYALINKQIVRQGDEIAGMSVERIEKDRVIISRGGRSFILTWGR